MWVSGGSLARQRRLATHIYDAVTCTRHNAANRGRVRGGGITAAVFLVGAAALRLVITSEGATSARVIAWGERVLCAHDFHRTLPGNGGRKWG